MCSAFPENNTRHALASLSNFCHLFETRMPQHLEILLRRYATRGLEEWQECVPLDERNACRDRLGLKIVENVWDIQNTIMSTTNSASRFIPTPKVNHGGIQHCFFLPIGNPYENEMKFELFLVVDDDHCLGFRFETAGCEGTHNYSHVQITSTMTLSVKGIPDWLPISYPAFPTGSANPWEMFLYMATSIHGCEGGMTRVIQEIFRDDPTRMKEYLAVLAKEDY